MRKSNVTRVEAAIAFMLQHSHKLGAMRAPLTRCGVVRKDFTQVPLEWSLGDFLNSRWAERERALPFRRNVMDKVQTGHAVFKNWFPCGWYV